MFVIDICFFRSKTFWRPLPKSFGRSSWSASTCSVRVCWPRTSCWTCAKTSSVRRKKHCSRSLRDCWITGRITTGIALTFGFINLFCFYFDCCLLPSAVCVRFAVPLSEIDFSQCLKCSPSYRALPKDYPKPKCTERSAEEASVLNDSVRLFVSFTIDTCSDYNSLPPSKFHF